MRIKGFIKGGKFGPAYVIATIIIKDLDIKSPIELLLDTGATRTTILDRDAIRLGIDYSKLEKHREGTLGIGGVVETYIIRNIELVFITEDRKHYKERLDMIYVLKHKTLNDKILRLPSILGRDVLNKYKLVLHGQKGIVIITDEILQI